jgi:methionine synthase I (cobalamin-dependent)
LEKAVLVFDGAMGTTLQSATLVRRTMAVLNWKAAMMLSFLQPPGDFRCAPSFLQAGADVIETDSFAPTA